MKQLKIKTHLRGKDEVFKILALAHSTGLPCLLVGEPGTGKTQAILEYAQALGYTNPQDHFIIEVDEGMKPSEVKGRLNMQTFIEHGRYELLSPVTKAKFILINEVDKASSGLRNALLGIMNEKAVFNGDQVIPCVWEGFFGACNRIIDDVAEAPFWDRFVIKYTVGRVGVEDLVGFYYAKRVRVLTIKLPEAADLKDIRNIQRGKLHRLVSILKDKAPEISDRTLSKLPQLIMAVHHIWGLSIGKAMIKTVAIVGNSSLAQKVANELESKEFIKLMTKIERISALDNKKRQKEELKAVDDELKKLLKEGKLAKEDASELYEALGEIKTA